MSAENLAGYSFYEFRKILSSDQYSIGKKIVDFTRDFFANYRSIKESAELLPQPVIKSSFLRISSKVYI